jgi:hypothetical protein
MALAQFGAKAKGFLSSEAVLIAPETRTSSPVRIPRDPQSLMHVSHDGLFPVEKVPDTPAASSVPRLTAWRWRTPWGDTWGDDRWVSSDR